MSMAVTVCGQWSHVVLDCSWSAEVPGHSPAPGMGCVRMLPSAQRDNANSISISKSNFKHILDLFLNIKHFKD